MGLIYFGGWRTYNIGPPVPSLGDFKGQGFGDLEQPVQLHRDCVQINTEISLPFNPHPTCGKPSTQVVTNERPPQRAPMHCGMVWHNRKWANGARTLPSIRNREKGKKLWPKCLSHLTQYQQECLHFTAPVYQTGSMNNRWSSQSHWFCSLFYGLIRCWNLSCDIILRSCCPFQGGQNQAQKLYRCTNPFRGAQNHCYNLW